jgi:hypothetical protein
VPPGHGLEEARAIVEQAARDAGRDPTELGMEGRVTLGGEGVQKLAEQAERWREAGASHLSVNTMGAGLTSIDHHLEALEQAIGAIKR